MQSLIWPGPWVRPALTFQDRGRWLVPTLAALVALGLAAVMGARPAYRYVRTQRALRLVAQGEALAAQRRWNEVAPLVKSSLALAPGHVRCHRLAARFYLAAGSGRALFHGQQVIDSGTATYEERRDLASLATTLGRTDLARPWLLQLLQEKPNDLELYRTSLGLARRLKMDALQVETVERWMRAAPDAPEPQFEAGSLHWRSTNAASRSIGRQLLWGLAFGGTPYALPAIGVLATGTHLNRTETDLLWRRLDSLSPTNRWVKAELQCRLRPRELAVVVREIVGTLTPESSAREVTETVSWLADHGALAEILPLLTPERLAQVPRLEGARVQALIELGRLDEIRTVLESPSTNFPPHLLSLLRASAAQADGKPDQVSRHLELAAASAGNQPMAHLLVARFAEKLKQPRVALECWQHIARNFGTDLDAAMHIVRLARVVDNLAAAQPALASLRSQMSTDAGAALAAGYVDALLGGLRPELLLQLREIARTNAPAVHITAVLALAEWKGGDAATALRNMESTGTDWSQAEPRFQAVYAGVLGAAGQREAARLAARQVNPENLAREERALLEPWR